MSYRLCASALSSFIVIWFISFITIRRSGRAVGLFKVSSVTVDFKYAFNAQKNTFSTTTKYYSGSLIHPVRRVKLSFGGHFVLIFWRSSPSKSQRPGIVAPDFTVYKFLEKVQRIIY